MGKSILIIDDDPEIQSILREALEDEAYTVETASDGLFALEKRDLLYGKYDAILMDVDMPRLNGLQLLQVLHQHAWSCFRSIIVLSANQENLQQAVHMGAGYSLGKPFDLDTVLAVVECVSSKCINLGIE